MPTGASTAAVRIPKSLAIDAQQWNPATWQPDEEIQRLTAQGKINPTSVDTLRWRVVDGELKSNARVVQWTDGRYTLNVGTAVYDIVGGNRAVVQGSDGAALLAASEGGMHLDEAGALTGKSEAVLECIGPLQRQLELRPVVASTAATKAVVEMRLREMELADQTTRRWRATSKQDKAKRIKLFDELQKAQFEAYNAKRAQNEELYAAKRKEADKLAEYLEAEDEDSQADDDADSFDAPDLVQPPRQQVPSLPAHLQGSDADEDDLFDDEENLFSPPSSGPTISTAAAAASAPEAVTAATPMLPSEPDADEDEEDEDEDEDEFDADEDEEEDEDDEEEGENEEETSAPAQAAAGVKRPRVIESDSE